MPKETTWKVARAWAASMAVKLACRSWRARSGAQQGIVKYEKGQEEPADKARAQRVSQKRRDTSSAPKQER
jgi:hypothetical protein